MVNKAIRYTYMYNTIISGVGSKLEVRGLDLSKILSSNKKGSLIMAMHNFAAEKGGGGYDHY